MRRGRRKEFAAAYAEHGDEILDPLEVSTLQLAMLDWGEVAREDHRARLDLVTRLLATRKSSIVPLLPDLLPGAASPSMLNGLLNASWPLKDWRRLRILANFAENPSALPRFVHPHNLIWGNNGAAREIFKWSVIVLLENS